MAQPNLPPTKRCCGSTHLEWSQLFKLKFGITDGSMRAYYGWLFLSRLLHQLLRQGVPRRALLDLEFTPGVGFAE